MPWCPECNNEYQDGFNVCTDCGCALVDSLPDRNLIPYIFGSKDEVEEMKRFLEYNNLTGMEIQFDEEENVYELYIPESDKALITRLANTYMQQKALQKQPAVEEAIAEAEKPSEGIYMESAVRAEENRSSAWVLLIVGGAGIVFVILGILDLLPIRLGGTQQYMVYGIMSALFLLFFIMGVVSMKNSRIFAQKAESENSLKLTLEKWCQDNLKKERLDQEIYEKDSNEGEFSEEVLYFTRFELVKAKLSHQFLNLDEAFLNHFIDEVYDMIFGEDAAT